ncbi:MAG: DUF4190 domain-containing protein [Ktedonobacterales bacterium]|nr:DUF4190 domain-containing protein [Ktedonobacterales bacterium]
MHPAPDEPTTPPTGDSPPPYPPAGAVSQPYYAGPMAPATSGWAIASLASAIFGIWPAPFVGSVLGIIFGHVALRDIRRSNGQREGRRAALAGLIIGYASLVVLALVIVAIVVFRVRFGHFHRFRLIPMP